MNSITVDLMRQRERRQAIRTEGKIRSLPCPFCGAREGEACHSVSWWPTEPHAARKAAAGL